jgi:hypothetical protein
MGYMDYETDETPEERRMRLLAEMGSPFLGNRRDADLGTVDSGGVFGMGPQGFQIQPDAPGLGAAWLDPGQRAGGSGVAYQDPPRTAPGASDMPVEQAPRLGNYFSKPGEPPAPEHDGILYNGTRSPAGRDVLAKETPTAAIPAGPIASPDDINVQGANNQDRTNAPRSADAPKTAAPAGLPTMAGALGTGPAGAFAATPPRVGASGAETPAAPAVLSQPQAAAAADGLSRKPGSPAAMTWLQDNADLFIALGAGLLSGKNIGEGIIQGLHLANEQKSTSAKQKLLDEKNQAENLKKSRMRLPLMKAFPGQFTAETAIASQRTAISSSGLSRSSTRIATEEGKILGSPEEKAADWHSPGRSYRITTSFRDRRRPEPIGTAPTEIAVTASYGRGARPSGISQPDDNTPVCR